ncbi:MAG: DUF5309 family protein [Planctomycetota bacterium]
MAFTGKATHSAGATLPEILEDVSDIIGIVSPHETPLLDHLGDARRAAQSTVHEWLEDSLLPNHDTITETTFSPSATGAGTFEVANPSRFRVGDIVRVRGKSEVMHAVATTSTDLVVQRGYGGTTAEALETDDVIDIIGNAALEGDDKPEVRFTNRVRKQNFSQILTASVEVSGSQLAVQKIGVDDELDYQKQERLRELLRDLENCVINGVAAASNPEGNASTRRTMRGIISSLSTNIFTPGVGGFPDDGSGGASLTEPMLNQALESIWDQSSGVIDTIVVGGTQKRKINGFATDARGYLPEDTAFRDMIGVYESDFGVAKVVLSRWMPPGSALLLDSSRIDVLPLSGRSFHAKKLASSGDSECMQVIGEYTLEVRNENAHGVIAGLATG